LFSGCHDVLEVASGTGQHACYFAEHMPWLAWQPTELCDNLSVLAPRCNAYAGDNLASPIALDVRANPWPARIPGGVFTANSLHIMAWESVVDLFSALAREAAPGTRLGVYGPFNYNGQYTSESNARFDQWLAAQHPESAIRDFEAVDSLAQDAGFSLLNDHPMPANNRLLAWQRL
ncbi:MAG: DUF938 domain-containing protein, partial [Halioglobus sp.]